MSDDGAASSLYFCPSAVSSSDLMLLIQSRSPVVLSNLIWIATITPSSWIAADATLVIVPAALGFDRLKKTMRATTIATAAKAITTGSAAGIVRRPRSNSCVNGIRPAGRSAGADRWGGGEPGCSSSDINSAPAKQGWTGAIQPVAYHGLSPCRAPSSTVTGKTSNVGKEKVLHFRCPDYSMSRCPDRPELLFLLLTVPRLPPALRGRAA